MSDLIKLKLNSTKTRVLLELQGDQEMKDRQPYLAASALCTLSSIAWFYFGMTNRDPLDMNAAIWAMIVAIWVKQQ